VLCTPSLPQREGAEFLPKLVSNGSPPLWGGFRWGFIEILIINAFHYTD